MLPELHGVLRELIYGRGQIDRDEVDIAFEAPTSQWLDGLVRPTLCLYLFELQENLDLRQAQLQTRHANGRAEFHAPPRRIDLHYMVTALTTETDDAFRLMWRALGVLVRTPELDAELFPDTLILEAPVLSRVAEP